MLDARFSLNFFLNLNRLQRGLSAIAELLVTALHGMQTRSSDENSVRPSVCPSVRHTREL